MGRTAEKGRHANQRIGTGRRSELRKKEVHQMPVTAAEHRSHEKGRRKNSPRSPGTEGEGGGE